MLLEAIRTLYAYHHQATRHLLDVAREAGDDVRREVVSGQPPILNTFVHLCGTQRIHLDWWSGALPGRESFSRRFTLEVLPDLAAVRAFWDEIQRDTETFLESLREDEELDRICLRPLPGGAVKEVPLWLSMLHVANHGTQHRSEAAMVLTALGHSPGDMELVEPR